MSSPPEFYGSLEPFAETFRHGVPALLYHKIATIQAGVRRRGLYLSPTIFRAQLRELRAAQFTTTAPASATSERPRGVVVLTFDDGFQSALENGAPILREFGCRAINFLIPGLLGRTNVWDQADGERLEPLMNDEEVCAWLAAGHQIGAHTMTHPSLPTLPLAVAREEISASKKALEDRFSLQVPDFAYPFGHWSPAVRDLVGEAGFERAWTVRPDVINHRADPLALPRFPAAVSLRNPVHLLRSLPRPGPALWRLLLESARLCRRQKI